MGTIEISGKPFHFQDVELTYENATIIDKSTARRNLTDFKHILDKRNVEFCIMHGTLLGAVREHGFIGHDIDIDTCTTDEKALVNCIPELYENGLKLCRYESGIIYSSIRDGVYIDVYVVNKLKGIMGLFFVRYLNRIIPRKYFTNMKTLQFLDETFTVPSHTMELIEFWYGKNWRTPLDKCPSNDSYKPGDWLEKHFKFLFKNE